jgi:myosin heavy subunit
LYNKYIFEKELEILREDGLQKELASLNFPNNDNILSLMHSKKVSLFSIVNDLTPHQQFKDSDMLMGVKKEMGNNQNIVFPQNAPSSFVIKHSQCAVTYRIEGFKLKNKDKIKD